MLACDVLMHVRASRTISPDQVLHLERLVFGGGAPTRDQIDILLLIDSYLHRREPRWTELLTRAAGAALLLRAGTQPAPEPLAKVA
jgi:hypothetical protein